MTHVDAVGRHVLRRAAAQRQLHPPLRQVGGQNIGGEAHGDRHDGGHPLAGCLGGGAILL